MDYGVGVIKGNGKKRSIEKFDREKLHDSIIYACYSVRTPDGQAEANAKMVCDEVIEWLQNHKEVTSQDIRNVAAKYLKNYNPDAAYIYEQKHITL